MIALVDVNQTVRPNWREDFQSQISTMAEFNVDSLLNAKPTEYDVRFNQRDLILYALGIGETDLKFIYENHDGFAAFPLYPVVLPFKTDSFNVVPFPPASLMTFPDEMPEAFNPAMIVHGEQSLELFQPFPNAAEQENVLMKATSRIVSFLDKGKGTLMEAETTLSDAKGQPICKLISGSFIRGLTGFRGKGRHKNPPISIPSTRQPDFIHAVPTSKTQASLYRLSGDYNSLHIDPEFAEGVGFKAPILHGLCTMGAAARSLYKMYCDENPSAFKFIQVRFSKPVYPGETLETRMWTQDDGLVHFQTYVKERNAMVIDGGVFKYSTGIIPSKL